MPLTVLLTVKVFSDEPSVQVPPSYHPFHASV
jgi:hypothetical protein